MTFRTMRGLAARAGALLFVARVVGAQTMSGMPSGHVAGTAPVASAAAATVTIHHGPDGNLIDIGPIDLPAHAMHDMVRQPPVTALALGMDGWGHGYDVEITDAAGKPVPHEILHHMALTDPQRRELFTPLMLRLAAAGTETAPVILPRFLGVRVRPTDSVLVSVMVHNPTDRAYHGVHVKLHMHVTSASWWTPTLSVYPVYLDVMPPTGGHSFDVPAGRSEYHWDGSPAVAGRILGLSGHLHRYGVLLQLEDRTAHKILWSVKPDTDATGNIKDIPISTFLWKFGIPVRPDHVYRLTAVYDNPTGKTIFDGGMGAVGGVIHPTGDDWPTVDRANPIYQFDWKYTWRDTIAPNDAPMRAKHP